MRSFHKSAFFLLLSLAIAAGIVIAAQQSSTSSASKQKQAPQPTTSSKGEIARGEYLVVEVAQCPECHTPRDSEGKLDRSQWLKGGPVWIRPTNPKISWSLNVPALKGFPYTDQQGQDVLEKGIGTNGIPIQQPMHIYHLHHEDALAIIAYLRSQ
jgi:mono/diheme cytochrome c family protein